MTTFVSPPSPDILGGYCKYPLLDTTVNKWNAQAQIKTTLVPHPQYTSTSFPSLK